MSAPDPALSAPSGQPTRLSLPQILALIIGCAMIMGAGWGIRGAFGHSRGAMMPGAMLGATLTVLAMRPDWWRRAAIIAFACSMGWGVGGQSSYGILIGYTVGGTTRNAMFGYASLWLVGGLYSGIGAGFLALTLTRSRSFLRQFAPALAIMYAAWLVLRYLSLLEPVFESLLGPTNELPSAWFRNMNIIPMSIEVFQYGEEQRNLTFWLHDTIWLCVLFTVISTPIYLWLFPRWRKANTLILLLALGWFAGMFFFIKVAGFRINPHRAETWGGVLGLQLMLVFYFIYHRNWAGFMLVCYGFIAGAFGFAVGDFIQMVGRAQWGPIGEYAWLREFGYWSLMEQFFGCIMGVGTAIGLVRLVNKGLAPPVEDVNDKSIDVFSLFFLFGPLLVFNFQKPLRVWLSDERTSSVLFTFPIANWTIPFACFYLLVLLFMLYRLHRGKLAMVPATHLGQSQLLAFLMSVAVLLMYVFIGQISATNLFNFLTMISIGLICIFSVGAQPVDISNANVPADSRSWFPGVAHWMLWAASPFVLWGLAALTMQFEMKQNQYRFPEDIPPPEPEVIEEEPKAKGSSLRLPNLNSTDRFLIASRLEPTRGT